MSLIRDFSLKAGSSRYSNVILFFLLFANIFDMGGAIGIKYISYIFLILYLILTLSNVTINKNILAFGAIFFIIYPIFSLCWGTINGGDFSLGLSQITSFFVMIAFFLFTRKSDMLQPIRYMYNMLFILGLVIIALFLLLLIYREAFNWPILSILRHPGMGYFGFRIIGSEIFPNIYFRATLFLVPAFIYFFCIKKKLAMLVCLLALICSFSKAAFVMIIIFLGIYALTRNSSITQKVFSICLIILVLVSVFSFMPSWADEIFTTFKGETKTAQIRIMHFESFKSLLNQNPLYLLIGQGVGTSFYTSATNSFVSNIEIDHINTIRKFGIIWFIIFSLIVLNVSLNLIRSNNNELIGCGYALIFSYIVTGTNPVLLSPLSLMLIVASNKALEARHVRVC